MRRTLAQARSFNRPIKLLLVNQFTINLGFYMLMPYLAGHLSNDLHLAAWLVGLTLGVRNLSQQGLFLIGGSLADRYGYKPMILAGLTLRTAGFGLLGFATDLPALLLASALTGLAGALFNPAVRAYLAQEAGDRRVEAFAVFNVFYQAGLLAGPLVGLLLGGITFRLSCLVAAAVFAFLAVAQARALPPRQGSLTGTGTSLIRDWRSAMANRPFLLFSLAMVGSYVLNFQVYLGLPIQAQQAIGGGQAGVLALFTLSGVLSIAGQVRVTSWVERHWSAGQAITRGLMLMASAFLPLAATAGLSASAPTGLAGQAAALAPCLLSTALLTLATMIVYPFEMSTIVALGGQRMVGTYYGLYNTLSGIGLTVGNLATGAALDAGRCTGHPALPWLVLTALGSGCATCMWALNRSTLLTPTPQPHRPKVTAALTDEPC